MNERIQELIQSTVATLDRGPLDRSQGTDAILREFAEQIVIDCAGIAYNNDGLDNEEISRLILETFGVR
jgi:hypothetical protein